MTSDPVLTTAMRLWQFEHGRTLREAIPQAIKSEGSIAGAARRLKLHHITLREWIDRLGIRIETRTRVVADPGDSALPAAS